MELRIKIHFRNGTNKLNVATLHASCQPGMSIGHALDDTIRSLRKQQDTPIRITDVEIVGSVEIK